MKKLMQDIAKERAKVEATEAWWLEHQDVLLPVANALDELGADVEVCVSGSPDLTVRLSGDAHALTAAIRALRTRGFAHDGKPPQKGSTHWSEWFRRDGAIDPAIYFSFSSTVCRRVKVGTKIVPEHEEDVYETVCGEVDGELQPIAPQTDTQARVAKAVEDIPF